MIEKEIYGDIFLRKPDVDELSSSRKEPDLFVIYAGLNAENTIMNHVSMKWTEGMKGPDGKIQHTVIKMHVILYK